MDAQTLAWILASGLATVLGGALLLAFPRPSGRTLDVLLGFTAGVMLGATIFSLLVPALDDGETAEVLVGFVLGGAVLAVLDVVLPHAHARLAERRRVPAERQEPERRAFLLLAALTIHNVPEGLAVGVAFAAGGPSWASRSRSASASRTSPRASPRRRPSSQPERAGARPPPSGV